MEETVSNHLKFHKIPTNIWSQVTDFSSKELLKESYAKYKGSRRNWNSAAGF